MLNPKIQRTVGVAFERVAVTDRIAIERIRGEINRPSREESTTRTLELEGDRPTRNESDIGWCHLTGVHPYHQSTKHRLHLLAGPFSKT
jgi:hypothetical protein